MRHGAGLSVQRTAAGRGDVAVVTHHVLKGLSPNGPGGCLASVAPGLRRRPRYPGTGARAAKSEVQLVLQFELDGPVVGGVGHAEQVADIVEHLALAEAERPAYVGADLVGLLR